MKPKFKRGFLTDPGKADSYVAVEIDTSYDGKHKWADLKIADCTRSVILNFDHSKEGYKKLQKLKEHIQWMEDHIYPPEVVEQFLKVNKKRKEVE